MQRKVYFYSAESWQNSTEGQIYLSISEVQPTFNDTHEAAFSLKKQKKSIYNKVYEKVLRTFAPQS